ncbi:MAG: LLM class flavin-dependent oxidoreductase, partial [Solirubrobacterales bacterium]|nr:LLM class flavin-dependent oxidoreductase [Solirubrobacterales bacterium]
MTTTSFGVFLIPDAEDHERTVGRAITAEELGLDLIGIQDHPYQRRFLDTFVLLSFIAARTRRIRLTPDVANLPLRPPAVLAKMAATIDVLSEGRFELGLGAGSFWDAIEGMGGPRRTSKQSVDAL